MGGLDLRVEVPHPRLILREAVLTREELGGGRLGVLTGEAAGAEDKLLRGGGREGGNGDGGGVGGPGRGGSGGRGR